VNTVIITRGQETNIKFISTTFDKCHICLNMDYILSLTREIIDISIIFKTYTRKWDLKFKVKEYIKQTIIKSLNFEFKESQFIWYMSHSRYVVFSLADFHTKPIQIPFKKEDKVGLCYFSK
jgi:hypothetical protein